MAIRDIRNEYEAIHEAQQGADTDSWYKAKFNEMMAASQRASGDLASSKEEVIWGERNGNRGKGKRWRREKWERGRGVEVSMRYSQFGSSC